MSDAIYDDVIRTESERTVMTVDIYERADRVRDGDFRTKTNTQQLLQRAGSDCVKIRNSRASVLLCVLLLTAVIVLCVHIHTNNTNYTQDRDELLTNITNLMEERNQILINIANLTNERNQLLVNNNGWLYYKFSFYYISSEKKNWNESRRYCSERGADLIIINNSEEHNFFQKILDSAEVYIGLTDSEVEGIWKWVDGSMTSGFWASGEPNGGRGENCVVSYPSGWHDYPCNTNFKWICEKKVLK